MQRWVWIILGLGFALVVAGAWLGRDSVAAKPVPEASLSVTGINATLPPRISQSGVEYPPDFRESFVRYLTVERNDATVRDLYINPESVDAFRTGRALPENTVIVVDAYDAQLDPEGKPLLDSEGHFLRGDAFEMVHVIHKRSDWQDADFPGSVRIEDWNFGSFDAAGNRFDESLIDCFNCHNAAFATDFLYTYPQLNTFYQSGEAGYFFCDLPNRLPCKD